MIFALVFAWFGAVSGAQARVDAWTGRPLDDLIRAWGPPSAMATLSDGSKVADWSSDTVGQPHSWNYGNGYVATNQPQYHCRARISTDVAGKITTGKVEGDNAGCTILFRDKQAPA